MTCSARSAPPSSTACYPDTSGDRRARAAPRGAPSVVVASRASRRRRAELRPSSRPRVAPLRWRAWRDRRRGRADREVTPAAGGHLPGLGAGPSRRGSDLPRQRARSGRLWAGRSHSPEPRGGSSCWSSRSSKRPRAPRVRSSEPSQAVRSLRRGGSTSESNGDQHVHHQSSGSDRPTDKGPGVALDAVGDRRLRLADRLQLEPPRAQRRLRGAAELLRRQRVRRARRERGGAHAQGQPGRRSTAVWRGASGRRPTNSAVRR